MDTSMLNNVLACLSTIEGKLPSSVDNDIMALGKYAWDRQTTSFENWRVIPSFLGTTPIKRRSTQNPYSPFQLYYRIGYNPRSWEGVATYTRPRARIAPAFRSF
ncbi:hypothetical protein SNK05_011391 [Fusarium graminearum]